MSPNPYRVPPAETPEPPAAKRPIYLDVAGAAAIAWMLAVMRVVIALRRGEGEHAEVDLAWLIVGLAPIVVWKEIASQRPRERRDDGGAPPREARP